MRNRSPRSGAEPESLGYIGVEVALGLMDDYEEYGADVIEGLRRNDPLNYIKLVLWIAPLFETSLKQIAAGMSEKDRLELFKSAAEALEKKIASSSPSAS